MSGQDIRNFMNLMESALNEASTNKHGFVLDLIHDIFKLQSEPKLNRKLLRDKLTALITYLPSLESRNNPDYHNKLEVIATTLKSIIRQLNPTDRDKLDFRSPDAIKDLVRKMLRTIYNEIIANDSSFEELAQSNSEAKDKISKLASLIYDKSTDQAVKKATKLIHKQAQQIN